MNRGRAVVAWAGLALVALIPLIAAATSPLLEWRDPVYVVAGISGVAAMALLLFQPLLAVRGLPGLSGALYVRAHQWVGAIIFLCLLIHVAGLWVTSPPDMIDALLFVSPTAFSQWGVIAMWALIATVGLVWVRRRRWLGLSVWRIIHQLLALVIVTASVIHALLIEGTMEVVSKSVLCLFVSVVTLRALWSVRMRK